MLNLPSFGEIAPQAYPTLSDEHFLGIRVQIGPDDGDVKHVAEVVSVGRPWNIDIQQFLKHGEIAVENEFVIEDFVFVRLKHVSSRAMHSVQEPRVRRELNKN